MTIAIKRNNGNLIWFDAVTSFDRRFSGAVSKHPLESGSVLTDHTTVENEVISLSGVWSDADFNINRPTIDQQQGELWGVTNKQFVNSTPSVGGIVISDDDTITPFLPEVVGQFVKTSAPKVYMPPASSKVRPAESLKSEVIEMFNSREDFTLLDFQRGIIKDAYTNCVITSLDFAESPDSGNAVYPVFTIERVKYAYISNVQIQKKPVASKVKKQASQPKACGTQVSQPFDAKSQGLPPKQEAIYSTAPASDMRKSLGGN